MKDVRAFLLLSKLAPFSFSAMQQTTLFSTDQSISLGKGNKVEKNLYVGHPFHTHTHENEWVGKVTQSDDDVNYCYYYYDRFLTRVVHHWARVSSAHVSSVVRFDVKPVHLRYEKSEGTTLPEGRAEPSSMNRDGSVPRCVRARTVMLGMSRHARDTPCRA